jgi:hypothetical protein
MTARLFSLIGVTLLVAVAEPVRAGQCRTVTKAALDCLDGDPTCDLDGRCDGRCIVALCDTGTPDAPRPTFCAGTLAYSALANLVTGRSFTGRAGTCPRARRRVRCRAVAEGSECDRHVRRCTVSVDAPAVQAPAPATTRCRIDVFRAYRSVPFANSAWRIDVRLPEAPYSSRGLLGSLTIRGGTPLREGVFAPDPDRRFGFVAGNLGGESIPIRQVNQERLELVEVSKKPSLWTDDIHGTLDLDLSGGPLDPRRAVVHLEF